MGHGYNVKIEIALPKDKVHIFWFIKKNLVGDQWALLFGIEEVKIDNLNAATQLTARPVVLISNMYQYSFVLKGGLNYGFFFF